MVFRVKLIGSGVPDDPYRVNLPTYALILQNTSAGWAIVSVPDEVHGLSLDEQNAELPEWTSHGPYLARPSPAALAKIHAYFDDRYQEHKGEFRVEPA